MSNPAIPFGFLENGLADGAMPTFGMFQGYLSVSNANKIYKGDVAKPMSGGFYDVFTAAVGGGEQIGGIFGDEFAYQSISYSGNSRNRAWLGNTGDVYSGSMLGCKIYTHRDTIFQVRTAGTSGGAVGQSAVGQNANFAIGPAPGNNLISAFWLDDSTIGTGPSLPFTIYGIAQQPITDPTSINNIVFVRFNNQVLT